VSLGPNDAQTCPSPGRLMFHRAHGQICPVCEPDAEWTAPCPVCCYPVTVVGLVVQPHQRGGPGTGFKRQECAGGGWQMGPPTFEPEPFVPVPVRVHSVAALRVLERGGVS